MGKITSNSDSMTYQIRMLITSGVRQQFYKSFEEARKTKKKPYCIQCNDWYVKFNKWPFNAFLSDAIPKWRNFRTYRTENARNRALKDLKKHYKYRYKFRIPPKEQYRIDSITKLKEVETKFCKFLKNYFGGKNG